MVPTDDRDILAEQLAIIDTAKSYAELLKQPGWHRLQQVQDEWLMEHLAAVKDVDTSDAPLTADLVRKWQLAEQLVDRQRHALESAFKQAEQVKTEMTLDTAILYKEMNES